MNGYDLPNNNEGRGYWPEPFRSIVPYWPELFRSIIPYWPELLRSTIPCWPELFQSINPYWPEQFRSIIPYWPEQFWSIIPNWPGGSKQYKMAISGHLGGNRTFGPMATKSRDPPLSGCFWQLPSWWRYFPLMIHISRPSIVQCNTTLKDPF